MQRRWFRTAVLVSCAVAAGWVSLHAQTHFASLTGAVASSDGVSVPNVEVVATNQDTQVAYPATSNDQGIYTITALPLGTYVIKARAQTFQPFETNPIKLESGQNARIDITLTVGVTEQVEVTAVSRILQTQNAVVGEVISGMTIEDMPLNGRNFSQLALLLPGVITTEPDSFTQPKNFGSGRPFVTGQREQENNYTLDGGLARAPEAITFDSLVQAFEAGDPLARRVVTDAGCYMGQAVPGLMGALNVQRIVIAGEMARFGPPLLDVIHETTPRTTLARLAGETGVDFEQLGHNEIILGASALILRDYSLPFRRQPGRPEGHVERGLPQSAGACFLIV